MTDTHQRDLELLENKVNTLEVALRSIFQALALHSPDVAREVILAIEGQAEACQRGGRPVGHVLLTGLADDFAILLADSQ